MIQTISLAEADPATSQVSPGSETFVTSGMTDVELTQYELYCELSSFMGGVVTEVSQPDITAGTLPKPPAAEEFLDREHLYGSSEPPSPVRYSTSTGRAVGTL